MRAATPIDRAKASMGYQNANQWRCTKGGFGVAAQAVCNEHQPYREGGAACPA
ncbi:hypothetical protein Alide_2049 [Alicycliphilus denitrificans BC]|nr:hypothetical protein Alide_2049 [Alicycliphilus denitrificans BC]